MWQAYSIPQVCGTTLHDTYLVSFVHLTTNTPKLICNIFVLLMLQHLIYFCLPDTLTCQQECKIMSSLLWLKRQNLPRVLKIEHVSSTEALSFTYSNWLAGNWSAQSLQGEVCLHWKILDLINMNNFVLCHCPSLTVQEVEMSRQHKDREKQLALLAAKDSAYSLVQT